MDEVFGEDNSFAVIPFKKKNFTTPGQAINDYLLHYAKARTKAKIRPLYGTNTVGSLKPDDITFNRVLTIYGRMVTPANDSEEERLLEEGGKWVTSADRVISQHFSSTRSGTITLRNRTISPGSNAHWAFDPDTAIPRLEKAGRLHLPNSGRLRGFAFWDDVPRRRINNFWEDTTGEPHPMFVVQTVTKVIQRCLLMTTDPGDLVLDPTCGSGTTSYVAEGWGRRWITIDTSRVALALARARIMGARYGYYLLSDSCDGQLKEAQIEEKAPSEAPTYGDIRQGFVYERVPHVTLKSIANNAEIDVIWERYEEELAPLRAELSEVCGQAKTLEEWEIPRERPEDWSSAAEPLLAAFWELRLARQKEIDASIAAKAEYEYLYDKPYDDKKKVRVAGPFTVESLSPHRVLGVDEDDELIDNLADAELGYGEAQDFATIILEHLKTSGLQQAHKEDRISFTSIKPWPGDLVCAEGRYVEGDPDSGDEKRAGIFIGPEFGTVSRPDLVKAAREAADADFDLLIACAFSYEAHSTDLHKLGNIPILKARMNADLHMAADLSNTGKGNLFVIFGEPDITVASGLWLVTSKGEKFANYEQVKKLSRLGSLEEINRVGRDGLSNLCGVSAGGSNERIASAIEISNGDVSDSGAAVGDSQSRTNQSLTSPGGGHWTDAQRSQTLAALQNLTDADFPLALTTGHWTQVLVHGVDVFHPNTGEIRSDSTDGIACWFIDTDYNSESFFVRHAYFLGANDPYKSLKTTLKAEINLEAWETLHSDTSRPFEKPASGRIAVKVINHLGDEVMKVFRV